MRQAGVVQVIDGQAAESVANRFNQDADDYEERTGQPFPGMVIDHEHFKHDPDKESVAYGWLMRLANRDGVLFGKIQWTSTGQPAVDGGDYRFFSTEYASKDLQVLNPGQSPQRVRPLRLDGLTLTNEPNNRGCSPITNRGESGNFDTRESYEAAKAENLRHVEANRAAAKDADSQRKAASEGKAAILAPLEAFCQTVQDIMAAATKSGHPMMSLPTAWTYAQVKFPDQFAAAFAADSSADPAAAGRQVIALANRIGALAGQNFNFGWNFVREELPQIFNRMTPAPAGRIRNRDFSRRTERITGQSAKIFNRLVRAESAITGLSDVQATRAIQNRRPGLYGLAHGTMTGSDALRVEPDVWAMVLKDEN